MPPMDLAQIAPPRAYQPSTPPRPHCSEPPDFSFSIPLDSCFITPSRQTIPAARINRAESRRHRVAVAAHRGRAPGRRAGAADHPVDHRTSKQCPRCGFIGLPPGLSACALLQSNAYACQRRLATQQDPAMAWPDTQGGSDPEHAATPMRISASRTGQLIEPARELPRNRRLDQVRAQDRIRPAGYLPYRLTVERTARSC